MSGAVTRLNAALEGRYRIERELGEGGMATVYLAQDVRHERKVALKVLKPEFAAVVGAERFLAEIKTTANLQHPHVLPLFDSGKAEDFLFYVMPYVEGESLRQRLDREHQLPLDDAIRIATAVAEALDYAHRRGVVHRDIKPANILMQDGEPIVADFGIALAARDSAAGTRLTETGLSLGTPGYMSPEQAAGDQEAGPHSDLYSLGCVVYEMLVGELPFEGRTAHAVLGKIMAGPPPLIRARRHTVPRWMEAAVLKALARSATDRHANARAFIDSLVTERLPEPSLRFRRWRSATIVAAAVVASIWATAELVKRTLEPSRSRVSLPSLLSVEDLTQMTFSGAVARGGLHPSPSGDLVLFVEGARYTLITNDRIGTPEPLWHERVWAGLESVHWYPEGTSLLAYGFHGDRDTGGVVEGVFQISVLNGDIRPLASLSLIGRGGGQPWEGAGGAVLDGECLYMPWPRRNRLLSLICAPANEVGTVDTVATVEVTWLSDARPLRFVLSPSPEWAYALDFGADSVFSVRLADGVVTDRRGIPRGISTAKWDEKGDGIWLLVESGGTQPEGLYRLPFDSDRGRFGREAMAHTLLPNLGITDFALAHEDSLLYVIRTVARSTRVWTGIVEAGETRNASTLTSSSALDRNIGPAIGPNGERLAYWSQDQLIVVGLETGAREVLGEFPHSRIAAMRWASDGGRIAFLTPSDSLAPNSISVIDVRTGARRLLPLSAKGIALDWMPSGQELAIVQNVGGRMGSDRLTLVDLARGTEEIVVDDLGFYRIDRLDDDSGPPSVDLLVSPSGRRVIALSSRPRVVVDLHEPVRVWPREAGPRPLAWLDSERLLVEGWRRVGVEDLDGQVEWLFDTPEYCDGFGYNHQRQVWACSGEERESNLFRAQLLQPSARGR